MPFACKILLSCKLQYFTVGLFTCIHVQQLTPFRFRNRRGAGCVARQKMRDWKRSNDHHALIDEMECLLDNALITDAVADSSRPSPPSMLGPVASPSQTSPAINDIPRVVSNVVRRLPLGNLEHPISQYLERSESPVRDESCRERTASTAQEKSFEDHSASPLRDEWSPYPTPPAAPRKDQFVSESDCSDNYNSLLRRPPPSKLFRNGRLMFHKTYEGPEPISYVDTGLYEGGLNDWYEAYTESDLLWARRLDLVLERHNIRRWATGAQCRRR